MFISRVVILASLWLSVSLWANDYSQLTATSSNDAQKQQKTLPLGTATDEHGNVLVIPETEQSDLEFNPQQYLASPQRGRTNTTTRTKKSITPTSRVADNPSCRWLNQRIDYLTAAIPSANQRDVNHYQTELTVREQEFNCMKCDAKGPSQADHARCQYRR
ncbi:hypothetical protein ACFOD0_15530 [Shewanella intestini]|uniref:Uncharacterized protein n=1 Tax=Shewanella intestini TaxID=2017544 RepID=A0ABS5I6V1_9GAMM|nr:MULTISPECIES: hypothetical protein [Shewanella]MBR9729100.1 hypothetical protein [Shewanella intestini]MRG37176.1 hypothetical protein [Shewanella sp. XMDDZSB0408]